MVEKKHFTVNKKIHFITLKLLTPKLLPSISRSSYKNPKEIRGFPDGSLGNESTCNVGDLGSIPGLGRSPGRGHGNSFQYSCLENPHGQRSLAGYSPWGCKESDMTERLSTHTNGIIVLPSYSFRFLLRYTILSWNLPKNSQIQFLFSRFYIWENSLVVQWLRLGAFTAVAQVQSLVGELRSHKLCGMAKKKRKVKIGSM